MTQKLTESQVLNELKAIDVELALNTPYVEGTLQKSKGKYTKRDGTVSVYDLAPVLQYPKAEGGQAQLRIPRDQIDHVKELIERGDKRKELLIRHRELSVQRLKADLRSGSLKKKR